MVVDARGLSCPMPVVMTQQAVKNSPSTLTVLVDNPTARENVTRFAENAGYTVTVKVEDEEYTLDLIK